MEKDMKITLDEEGSIPLYKSGLLDINVEEAALKIVHGMIVQNVPILKLN